MDDIARFELFCKLRSQIRGADNHLIVGIDIAKDKHPCFFLALPKASHCGGA